MFKRRTILIIALIAIPVFILLGFLLFRIPAIETRIYDLRARILYVLNPPDEAIFVPVTPTGELLVPTYTPSPTSLPPTAVPTVEGPTDTLEPSLTPTITQTPNNNQNQRLMNCSSAASSHLTPNPIHYSLERTPCQSTPFLLPFS